MVIQEQRYTTEAAQYRDTRSETPRRDQPVGGGLVRSRVQFFESPESKRTPPPETSPKPAILPVVAKTVPYPYTQQTPSLPPAVPPPVPRAHRTAPVPSTFRRRYPDSFSNELPMIDESRQEDFPVVRATASRSGSPLLEVGIDHYNRAEYVLAEKAFMTALKTQHANLTVDDLTTAIIMGNLGAVYLKQNKVEQAMQFLESSLGMKKNLGEDVIMADTYNNLGNCANLLGKYDDSLEFYRLALQELRKKRGRKADVADALFNIGRLEIHRENFKIASGVLHEALRLTKEVYGENHMYVAEASDLMGFVQVSLGKYEDALISFTKGLEIYRNANGPLHLDVANSIFNIGMVRETNKEYADAWEAYNTAQDLYRRLGASPEDPGFMTVRRSIAHVEKLIAQQNQARLVQKHHDALKKKKRPKDKDRDGSSKDKKGQRSTTNVDPATTPAL